VGYNIFHAVLKGFLRLFFRLESVGLENLPEGGCIVASNHISLMDPPAIGCSVPARRKIRFMAKEELFHIPILRWIIVFLGAFPVRRGMADRNAIRTALGFLKNGEVVGMFPEGTRSKTGKLGEPLPGMALLAVKAGVPVVPAVVIDTNKIFRDGHYFPQFRVRFGPPIVLPASRSDKENIEFITKTVMEEIARLLEEEGR